MKGTGMTSPFTASNPTLPKPFYYPLYVLFALMLLGWIMLAAFSLFLTLVTSFSFSAFPVPGKMEIAVMLLTSVLAAFKLRYTAIISLTESGIVQGGNTIAYDDIQRVEHIHRWYVYIMAFYAQSRPDRPIFIVCPTLLKDYSVLFTCLSEKSQKDIHPDT